MTFSVMTASGRMVSLTDPDPESLHLPDIAMHLACIRRFNGLGISVDLHSILVSEHLPLEFALAGLLHDAHEAYTGDISRPMRRAIDTDFPSSLSSIEDCLSYEIWLKFDRRHAPRRREERLAVQVEDDRAAGIEAEVLWGGFKPISEEMVVIERWWDALPERRPCWQAAVKRQPYLGQRSDLFLSIYSSLIAGYEPSVRVCSCERPRSV